MRRMKPEQQRPPTRFGRSQGDRWKPIDFEISEPWTPTAGAHSGSQQQEPTAGDHSGRPVGAHCGGPSRESEAGDHSGRQLGETSESLGLF